ncbi:MAG: HNH endonuclease [Chloroflexi bacterium]|nr:HNH endonuclease [Chloroflexota bacterium]
MPAVRPSVLVTSILDAIQQSGGSVVYLSRSDQAHPREFLVEYLDEKFSVWVYIWTLTHGGRVSLPNEYRIQITSVSSPLRLNPSGYTVLMGFYPDLGMFAGFDLRRHRTFTTGSPSVQISIRSINEALQNGLAFNTKTNLEIAVAVRPDQFLNYVRSADALHKYGNDVQTMRLLERAAEAQEITQQDIAELARERQTLVATVSRYSRDANFRQQVLNAYEHRCAVTRAQLKLVDAAHILPVPSERSSEHITNGIALSPTMHRAFDSGLIFLNEDYLMLFNEEKVNELTNENLHAGLNQMRNMLQGRIHLPADRRQWPNTRFIIEANRYRRIPGYRGS